MPLLKMQSRLNKRYIYHLVMTLWNVLTFVTVTAFADPVLFLAVTVKVIGCLAVPAGTLKLPTHVLPDVLTNVIVVEFRVFVAVTWVTVPAVVAVI
ncbi:hypothetical protein A7D23_00560 [Dehalobacter sp. TeCB1]|nr:hypothetical protein A7D23_00560 [Dehalobacter sp. TeCB1]